MRVKVQDQSTAAPSRVRQLPGRWVVEYNTSSLGGSTRSTTNQAVPGGPSGMRSPTWSGRCSSGTSWVALGQLPGNSSRSTKRGVYQPPRCQPIWTSHGHTWSGGTGMVAAWLVTTVGWSMSSSPGSGWRRSAWVDPAVRPSHWLAAITPTVATTIATRPRALRRRVPCRRRSLVALSGSLTVTSPPRAGWCAARPVGGCRGGACASSGSRRTRTRPRSAAPGPGMRATDTAA